MSTRQVNWTLILTVAIALVGWAVAGLRSYADETADVKQRIAVVETQQSTTDKRMERIENKIDRLIELTRPK